MPNIGLLALEAADGAVVVTSISLVFSMLVALCLIITLEGKIFTALSNKKKNKTPPPSFPEGGSKPAAPAVKAAAPAPAPASAPAADGGIPGEIIAAIAAAVASLEGEGAVVSSIRRIAKTKSANRRGAWGDAGVHEHTTPFM